MKENMIFDGIDCDEFYLDNCPKCNLKPTLNIYFKISCGCCKTKTKFHGTFKEAKKYFYGKAFIQKQCNHNNMEYNNYEIVCRDCKKIISPEEFSVMQRTKHEKNN